MQNEDIQIQNDPSTSVSTDENDVSGNSRLQNEEPAGLTDPKTNEQVCRKHKNTFTKNIDYLIDKSRTDKTFHSSAVITMVLNCLTRHHML